MAYLGLQNRQAGEKVAGAFATRTNFAAMTIIGQNYEPKCMAPYQGQPLGYQQLTTTQLGSAVGLTVPANATFALINIEGTPGTDEVRFRDDGTKPTSSSGTLLNGSGSSGWPPFLYAGDLTAIEFIAASGSPKLNVSFYR
jgi:hypothetical protein